MQSGRREINQILSNENTDLKIYNIYMLYVLLNMNILRINHQDFFIVFFMRILEKNPSLNVHQKFSDFGAQ